MSIILILSYFADLQDHLGLIKCTCFLLEGILLWSWNHVSLQFFFQFWFDFCSFNYQGARNFWHKEEKSCTGFEIRKKNHCDQSVPEIVSIPLGKQGRAALEGCLHHSTHETRVFEVILERLPMFFLIQNLCMRDYFMQQWLFLLFGGECKSEDR